MTVVAKVELLDQKSAALKVDETVSCWEMKLDDNMVFEWVVWQDEKKVELDGKMGIGWAVWQAALKVALKVDEMDYSWEMTLVDKMVFLQVDKQVDPKGMVPEPANLNQRNPE